MGQQMLNYQQQMLMMGQGQAQPQQGVPQAAPLKAIDFSMQGGGGDMPAAAKGGAVPDRDRGAALDAKAGLDIQVVRNKVLDLAAAIIGESDELESDTPLMEAGLTSNSAVILRDELSKDIPGVSLPPTLIFDYPSVSAMADFI